MLIHIVAFFLALAFSFALIPVVRKRAIAAGLYDAPGERKIHKAPIPRLGGIAIWSGFTVAALLLFIILGVAPLKGSILGVLAGGAIMFALGLMDDLFTLSPYLKLLIQFLAALTAFLLGVQINNLDLPGSQLLVLNVLSLPVTLLWIVGLSNAMNFIDGVDGLASGVTLISAITLAVIAHSTGQHTSALLAELLAGASLGFLAFNFHPAKIFMGDSGSLFSGFMLASIAVTGVLKTQVVVMLLPLFVLCVPIMDITFSVFRRLFRGQNPFLPDADHIHHQFIKAGVSQVHTVSYLYTLCIVGGLIATYYVNKEEMTYLIFYVGLVSGVYLLALILIQVVRRLYSKEAVQEIGQA
ncbi:MAG: MraY family glycosyltransferase [Vampirovibrionales bacterium]|nr:MraY family glycosyltransferase [Vampirovibrionales bacterium]